MSGSIVLFVCVFLSLLSVIVSGQTLGIQLTAGQLATAASAKLSNVQPYLTAFNLQTARYSINTPARLAAFIAQCSHESTRFARIRENLGYTAAELIATFPTHFNSANVQQYAGQPEKIANRVYASRMGNGDEASGDGWKYSGRGIIQLTGKSMYAIAGKALGKDLVTNPDLVLQPDLAVQTAAWFWNDRRLNDLADKGQFDLLTKRINGASKGLADRLALWAVAKKALTNVKAVPVAGVTPADGRAPLDPSLAPHIDIDPTVPTVSSIDTCVSDDHTDCFIGPVTTVPDGTTPTPPTTGTDAASSSTDSIVTTDASPAPDLLGSLPSLLQQTSQHDKPVKPAAGKKGAAGKPKPKTKVVYKCVRHAGKKKCGKMRVKVGAKPATKSKKKSPPPSHKKASRPIKPQQHPSSTKHKKLAGLRVRTHTNSLQQ